MKKYTDAEIQAIRDLDGKHCPTCFQKVTIDRYGVSATMVGVLRIMANITDKQLKAGGERPIDVRNTILNHNQRSSLTKMRFHGLIAKVKDDKGHQIAGHWLVTEKGYNLLRGAEILAQVETYDNTVIGHTEHMTNVHEIEKVDAPGNSPDLVQQETIGTAEARVMSTLREKKPKQPIKHLAEYLGRPFTVEPGLSIVTGQMIDVQMEPLQVGKPVIVTKPMRLQYHDITAFRKQWKIIT